MNQPRDRRRPGRITRILLSGRASIPLLIAIVFALGAISGGAFVMSVDRIGAESSLESEPAYQTFESVWELVHSHYIDPESVDDEELLYAATRGMVDQLNDKGHTVFLDPEDAEAFRASMKGELIGIGIRLNLDGSQPEIVTPIPGSPADRAGLKRGDIIVEVQGERTEGLSEGEISSLLRGPVGEVVELSILRPGDDRSFDIEVTRERIDIDQVVSAELPDDLVLIRLQDFSSGAGEELRQALDDSITDSTSGLVLDLRGNPGGLVHEAISVASQFMEEGSVIYVHESLGEEPNPVKTVGHDDTAFAVPMVVLVDEGSASAAEIVASALTQNDRAETVGVTTFGTGTVVSSFELDDGSIAAIGTAFWRSPDGTLYWNEGFSPEHEVFLDESGEPVRFDDHANLTDHDIESAGDSQLRSAIRLLVEASFPYESAAGTPK